MSPRGRAWVALVVGNVGTALLVAAVAPGVLPVAVGILGVLLVAEILLTVLMVPRFVSTEVPFITTWETTEAGQSITIPTKGGANRTDYLFEIDWGDGTTEIIYGDDPNPAHSYSEAGTYTVTISGTFPHLCLDSGYGSRENAKKMLTIEQWGDIEWESMVSAFAGAENMTSAASDVPDLSQVTDLSNMFEYATCFNGDIGEWDVSNVTSMHRTFAWAQAFNQDIGQWEVSSVTDMSEMFYHATAFNQPIGDWDVSRVTDMSGMMTGASAFNQKVGDWNVSTVSKMEGMFAGAKAFDQDIGSWDVSNVWGMENMFAGAKAFNQDISGWDVSSVLYMSGMFQAANAFNADIGGWDVSNVTLMVGMFDGAEAFSQDLGAWDISGLDVYDRINTEPLADFLTGAELSPTHYDALLNGWAELDLTDGLTFDAGQSQYTEAGADARQAIIDDHGWTIHDGGMAE